MANTHFLRAFILGYSLVFGLEPQCNKFSFEEQLLEKMVRLEFKVENIFDSVTKSQQEIKHMTVKVEEELRTLRKEKEQMKDDVEASKVDIDKRLVDTENKLEETLKDVEEKLGRLSGDLVYVTNRTKESYITYVRWGRIVCSNDSFTVYTGYASGSHYTHSGGPSHITCLPKDPQHGKHHPGNDGSYIYNAEYENNVQTNAIFGEPMEDQDVPCAVCEVEGKSALLMIPARMECYPGWRKEYSGYLMTEWHNHQRSELKCVDENPEKVLGQGGENNGALFYFVEAAGTIPDPPYTRGVELTCVVCTK